MAEDSVTGVEVRDMLKAEMDELRKYLNAEFNELRKDREETVQRITALETTVAAHGSRVEILETSVGDWGRSFISRPEHNVLAGDIGTMKEDIAEAKGKASQGQLMIAYGLSGISVLVSLVMLIMVIVANKV